VYLIDTNVISEYRKGSRADAGVRDFFEQHDSAAMFLPVQVIGEIQAGIARLRRRRDAESAKRATLYEGWLDGLLGEFAERVLDFDKEAARVWGALLSNENKDPHTIDKQIAAVALVNSLVLVRRDHGGGLRLIDPFTAR
jgi:predicted nucleic acid-binding protein